MSNIVVLGSSYITSAILKSLLYLSNVKIIVVDRKDPHWTLNQNLLSGIESLSTTVPDLRKNFDYKRGFKLVPDDSLSFLYYNPITESLKLFEELNKLDSIDIVVDTAMMFDPYYSESNTMDTVNINTTYPTAIFDVLRRLSVTPQLYINLSSGIVYGKQELKNLPSKEVTIPHPYGVRAGSLLARENLVEAMAKAYDIPYITLRIGTPIGYYTPFENIINQIIKHQLLKEPIVIEGNPDTIGRDFFDLNDLVSLLYKICANVLNDRLPTPPAHQTDDSEKEKPRITGFDYIEKIKNQIYNIGGHKTEGQDVITLTTLDRLVITALGKVQVPEQQGKIIVKNSRQKRIPFRYQFEEGILIQMDNRKAEDLLEYDPQYNLLDTIKTECIPYIGHNLLNYTDKEMDDLKKQLRL